LRDDVVKGVQDEVPQLYFAFNTATNHGLTERMIHEIENAKSGKAVDFDLIQSIDQSDASNQLLAIAAIRESREFDENFTRYLMQCTESKVATIVGAASVALQTQCETNPKTIEFIGHSFIPTNVAFKVVGQSIQFADPHDVADVLATLQNQIETAIQSPGLKYAALNVLAKAVIYCGDQYRSFAGELSPVNAKLLETMIGAERSRLNE
jgi:RNA-binding protein YhbY